MKRKQLKEKRLDPNVLQDELDVQPLADPLIYCYWAGLGYSDGAVIKAMDENLYKCDTKTGQGLWTPVNSSSLAKKDKNRKK
jgi:hypothetical protein